MNQYLKPLQDTKQAGYEDGLWQGIQFGANIAAIAYNHVCGIGRKRTKETEAEVNRLLQEIIRENDPVWTEQQIKRALEQIK